MRAQTPPLESEAEEICRRTPLIRINREQGLDVLLEVVQDGLPAAALVLDGIGGLGISEEVSRTVTPSLPGRWNSTTSVLPPKTLSIGWCSTTLA